MYIIQFDNMIISIEGNIGSGKTTLLSMVKKRFGEYMGSSKSVVYVPEPVSSWESIKDEDGKSMLDLLYADTKTHSFAFQMMAYITRVKAMKKARKDNPEAILVCERCLQTDSEVFARMLKEQGNIKLVHWKIYNEWVKEMSEEWKPDLVVYVRCSPEKSFERVKKRARDSESSVPLEYLADCHSKHEDWLMNSECSIGKMIVFDGEKEFVGENASRVDMLCDELKRLIH